MKKVLRLTLALVLAAFTLNVQAQNSNELMSEIGSQSEDVIQEAYSAENALNNLGKQYFIMYNNTPNVAFYLTMMNSSMDNIVNYIDEMNQKTNAVKAMVPNFDANYILSRTASIRQAESQIRVQSNALATAIQNGDRITAFSAYNTLKGLYATQLNVSDEILLFTEDNEVYLKVKIELVDYYGNPVPGGTLPGYYAQNQATNVYYYNDGDYNNPVIKKLAPGTYLFGAMDGYWDGASSKIVAIDPSMVNTDGYIVITLNYWSE